MPDFVCYNGKILYEEEVKVSPLNRGMMYGDGCFETFRSYCNRYLNLEDHYNRLCYSLRYLEIEPPLTLNSFTELAKSLVKSNSLNLEDSIVRVQVWRDGLRGYDTDSREANWIISNSRLPERKKSIRLIKAGSSIPNPALSRISKLSNGINYIKAAKKAAQKGGDDALMHTMVGVVSETTIANVFWAKDNMLFTPDINCDINPGITRKILLETEQVIEGEFEFQDILNSEFIFCTNSVHGLIPVHQLNKKEYPINHSFFNEIKDRFEKYKIENLK